MAGYRQLFTWYFMAASSVLYAVAGVFTRPYVLVHLARTDYLLVEAEIMLSLETQPLKVCSPDSYSQFT